MTESGLQAAKLFNEQQGKGWWAGEHGGGQENSVEGAGEQSGGQENMVEGKRTVREKAP